MRNDWRDFGRDVKPWPGTVSNLWWFVGGGNACTGDGGGKQSTFFRGFFTNTPHWKLWQPFYAQTTLQFRLRLRLDAHQQYSWHEWVPRNSQCGNVEGTRHAAFGRLTELTISFTLVSSQKKNPHSQQGKAWPIIWMAGLRDTIIANYRASPCEEHVFLTSRFVCHRPGTMSRNAVQTDRCLVAPCPRCHERGIYHHRCVEQEVISYSKW